MDEGSYFEMDGQLCRLLELTDWDEETEIYLTAIIRRENGSREVLNYEDIEGLDVVEPHTKFKMGQTVRVNWHQSLSPGTKLRLSKTSEYYASAWHNGDLIDVYYNQITPTGIVRQLPAWW